jgi:hypothetical protein
MTVPNLPSVSAVPVDAAATGANRTALNNALAEPPQVATDKPGATRLPAARAEAAKTSAKDDVTNTLAIMFQQWNKGSFPDASLPTFTAELVHEQLTKLQAALAKIGIKIEVPSVEVLKQKIESVFESARVAVLRSKVTGGSQSEGLQAAYNTIRANLGKVADVLGKHTHASPNTPAKDTRPGRLPEPTGRGTQGPVPLSPRRDGPGKPVYQDLPPRQLNQPSNGTGTTPQGRVTPQPVLKANLELR